MICPSPEPMLSGRQAIVLAVVQVMQDLVNRCREALLYVRGCQPRQPGKEKKFFFKRRAQQVHHAPAPARPRFPHQFLADVLALADVRPKLPIRESQPAACGF